METPADLVAFIEREHPRLVRAAHLLVGDHAVAEEIAQEALLRTASRWEKVRTLEAPGGWAHRVTVNLATSQLRRRRLERRVRAKVAAGELPVSAPPDTATSVVVRGALATLPKAAQRLLVLHHVLGWSAVSIGEIDGATSAAVRQRLHRARGDLREALEAQGLPTAAVAGDDTEAPTVVTVPDQEHARSRGARHRSRSEPPEQERSDVR